MPITQTEDFGSRVVTDSSNGVSMKRVFTVQGTYDAEAALNVVPQMGDSEIVLGKEISVLSREAERLETKEAMRVTVNYGSPEGSSEGGGGELAVTWEIDFTLESQHIRQVKSPAKQYNYPDIPENDVGLVIGEHGGEVEGVDIYIPRSQLIINKWWADASVTNDYLKNINKVIGKVNNAPFWLWKEADVLFAGSKVFKDQASFTKITYEFMASDTQENIKFTDINGVEQNIDYKAGWDYLWYRELKKVEDVGDKKVTKQGIVSAHVSWVYDFGDFSLLQVPLSKP